MLRESRLGVFNLACAKIGLFCSLDAAKIELLDTQCSRRRATRNRWIMDYQDTTHDVLFVASATVRVKLRSVVRPQGLTAGMGG
jgi:hypothetical protein